MSSKILNIIMTACFCLFMHAALADGKVSDEKIMTNRKQLITINQYVSHIALDAAYNGIMEALDGHKIVPDKAEIVSSNAQGNIATSVQISKHHASLSPDIMIAIATPAAQTSLKAIGAESTLAFIAVTDPESANLLGADNIIGISDSPPVEELVDIIRQVFPDLKTVGIISNAGEINSVKMSERMENKLAKFDIKTKKANITSSSDIKNAMNQLIPVVDIIYLPQDNTVISALDSIARISKANKMPLIANDPTLVNKGVALAYGSNYFASGRQLGTMIAQIINNQPLDEKIQLPKIRELKINQEIMHNLRINIPSDVQNRISMKEERK